MQENSKLFQNKDLVFKLGGISKAKGWLANWDDQSSSFFQMGNIFFTRSDLRLEIAQFYIEKFNSGNIDSTLKTLSNTINQAKNIGASLVNHETNDFYRRGEDSRYYKFMCGNWNPIMNVYPIGDVTLISNLENALRVLEQMSKSIVSVAVKYQDEIFYLPKPSRHADIYKNQVFGLQEIDKSTALEGFLTGLNQFLDRKQALQFALDHKIIKAPLEDACELYSEDLW